MSKKDEPASMNGISIIPSSEAYFEQMEILNGVIYDCDPREDDTSFTVEHYRLHRDIFAEGQFIAVETATNRVVGMTSCMRTHHQPSIRHHDSWWSTIGDG